MVVLVSQRRRRRTDPRQLSVAAEIEVACVPDVPRGRRVRALAGCVLLDQWGRILLLHRRDPCEQWELPGGKIEPGEAADVAACREVREELGVVVGDTKELGSARF